jgi:hypothetical protein
MDHHRKSPHEPFVSFITRRQADICKTDEQVAIAMGFERLDTFKKIKDGKIMLPVQKVAALASALSVEPAPLLRQLLTEIMPEVLDAVDQLLLPSR